MGPGSSGAAFRDPARGRTNEHLNLPGFQRNCPDVLEGLGCNDRLVLFAAVVGVYNRMGLAGSSFGRRGGPWRAMLMRSAGRWRGVVLGILIAALPGPREGGARAGEPKGERA